MCWREGLLLHVALFRNFFAAAAALHRNLSDAPRTFFLFATFRFFLFFATEEQCYFFSINLFHVYYTLIPTPVRCFTSFVCHCNIECIVDNSSLVFLLLFTMFAFIFLITQKFSLFENCVTKSRRPADTVIVIVVVPR